MYKNPNTAAQKLLILFCIENFLETSGLIWILDAFWPLNSLSQLKLDTQRILSFLDEKLTDMI